MPSLPTRQPKRCFRRPRHCRNAVREVNRQLDRIREARQGLRGRSMPGMRQRLYPPSQRHPSEVRRLLEEQAAVRNGVEQVYVGSPRRPSITW